MRLIDADKFIEDLKNPQVHTSSCGMTINDVIDIVMEHSEEVVRCMDCRWWVEHHTGSTGIGYCKDMCVSRKGYDYCSQGENKMKLIDADKAFEILSEYYHHRTDIQHDALREALDRVPEAVVRCKDCKRFKRYELYRGHTLDLCEEYAWQSRSVKLYDYCSHGIRRTDETD